MSYCSLKDRFTLGQKDRIHASMEIWPRNQLIDSPGCLPLTQSVVIEDMNDVLSTDDTWATYQWMICSGNLFLPIPGAIESAYSYSQAGEYAVEVTSEEGCVFTSQCYSVMLTGLADISKNSGLSIYPNPFTERINVRLSTVTQVMGIQIHDIYGRLVHSQLDTDTDDLTIELDLNSGIYTINVITDEFRAVETIMVIE